MITLILLEKRSVVWRFGIGARLLVCWKAMQELDEMWADALAAAQINGSSEMLDYLKLREKNDAARMIGIEWLFKTFLAVTDEANRRGLNLEIERNDANKFAVGAATMQGTKIKISFGVRSLTVEAGFPRAPQDGFVRGGLACARILHFGFAAANSDLLLVKSAHDADAPVWFAIGDSNLRGEFSISHLKNHFSVFLGQV